METVFIVYCFLAEWHSRGILHSSLVINQWNLVVLDLFMFFIFDFFWILKILHSESAKEHTLNFQKIMYLFGHYLRWLLIDNMILEFKLLFVVEIDNHNIYKTFRLIQNLNDVGDQIHFFIIAVSSLSFKYTYFIFCILILTLSYSSICDILIVVETTATQDGFPFLSWQQCHTSITVDSLDCTVCFCCRPCICGLCSLLLH